MTAEVETAEESALLVCSGGDAQASGPQAGVTAEVETAEDCEAKRRGGDAQA